MNTEKLKYRLDSFSFSVSGSNVDLIEWKRSHLLPNSVWSYWGDKISNFCTLQETLDFCCIPFETFKTFKFSYGFWSVGQGRDVGLAFKSNRWHAFWGPPRKTVQEAIEAKIEDCQHKIDKYWDDLNNLPGDLDDESREYREGYFLSLIYDREECISLLKRFPTEAPSTENLWEQVSKEFYE